MKIGILTFHCAHNYGAVLQAYAIQEQLKLMGFDVEIINYRPIYLLRPYGYLPQFHFRTIKDGYLRCLILNVKILLRWIGTLNRMLRLLNSAISGLCVTKMIVRPSRCRR